MHRNTYKCTHIYTKIHKYRHTEKYTQTCRHTHTCTIPTTVQGFALSARTSPDPEFQLGGLCQGAALGWQCPGIPAPLPLFNHQEVPPGTPGPLLASPSLPALCRVWSSWDSVDRRSHCEGVWGSSRSGDSCIISSISSITSQNTDMSVINTHTHSLTHTRADRRPDTKGESRGQMRAPALHIKPPFTPICLNLPPKMAQHQNTSRSEMEPPVGQEA